MPHRRTQDEWLWGWDPTPGIVSVWADASGRASVWRRAPPELALVKEEARYRPWLLLASLADLGHLGARLQPESPAADAAAITYRELEGSGELRFLVSAESSRALSSAVLEGASRRLLAARGVLQVGLLPNLPLAERTMSGLPQAGSQVEDPVE